MTGAPEGARGAARDPAFRLLRETVLAANLALPAAELVTLTWGNVSAIDSGRGVVAIKPSGVPYAAMRASDIVLVDVDGIPVEPGGRSPSTDTPTHLALYRAFPQIGGIVHTHSTYATAWAQAQRPIPLLGTTHADLCAHPIPLTRPLTAAEIGGGYERATGEVIIDAVRELGPQELPCALVRGHAPFCWAADAATAVDVAVTLEEVARMAAVTLAIDPDAPTVDDALRRTHHARKHGPDAYYGQR